MAESRGGALGANNSAAFLSRNDASKLQRGRTLYYWLRDKRQNLTFKWGWVKGKNGRPFKCPWWADSAVFALAYMNGKIGLQPPDPAEIFPDRFSRDAKGRLVDRRSGDRV
jgi:hypothetical protein